MTRQLRPAPPPLEANDNVILGVFTAAWGVAIIVLLIIRDQLSAADQWWIWVPVTGFIFGIFGFVFVPHLKRSRARAAERRQQN